ncbi:hypothetical protein FPQ18DRAFT_392648 [Pyronema domesticum]|uniref:F-box domain-containing protein n=1 Tax=Pyronema omphalodes (strain CBS 100304) TaxID=1076935 RepID=U4LQQ5_PYROM|nr:hypothetical protein FPQ18DRAFT_392648 [Pyronema domesticum]CCX31670.1 Similar to hypothetical protein [Botryotinia fuckeliana]; acc. no. CCD49410 [Pyronema omphalodes CBS 100304]
MDPERPESRQLRVNLPPAPPLTDEDRKLSGFPFPSFLEPVPAQKTPEAGPMMQYQPSPPESQPSQPSPESQQSRPTQQHEICLVNQRAQGAQGVQGVELIHPAQKSQLTSSPSSPASTTFSQRSTTSSDWSTTSSHWSTTSSHWSTTSFHCYISPPGMPPPAPLPAPTRPKAIRGPSHLNYLPIRITNFLESDSGFLNIIETLREQLRQFMELASTDRCLVRNPGITFDIPPTYGDPLRIRRTRRNLASAIRAVQIIQGTRDMIMRRGIKMKKVMQTEKKKKKKKKKKKNTDGQTDWPGVWYAKIRDLEGKKFLKRLEQERKRKSKTSTENLEDISGSEKKKNMAIDLERKEKEEKFLQDFKAGPEKEWKIIMDISSHVGKKKEEISRSVKSARGLTRYEMEKQLLLLKTLQNSLSSIQLNQPKKPTPITSLPSEILLSIVPHLDYPDLISLSRTCHHLRYISLDHVQLKKRFQQAQAVVSNYLKKLLRHDVCISERYIITRRNFQSKAREKELGIMCLNRALMNRMGFNECVAKNVFREPPKMLARYY